MARARSANVVTAQTTKKRVRVLSPQVQGRPQYAETVPQRRIGTIRPFRARTVRTLQKVDIAKGITQPEAKIANERTGQITSRANPRILHLQPQNPPTSGSGQRVVAPPSPTNRGGVRNPYNTKQRAGRTIGKSRRYSGKRMK